MAKGARALAIFSLAIFPEASETCAFPAAPCAFSAPSAYPTSCPVLSQLHYTKLFITTTFTAGRGWHSHCFGKEDARCLEFA